MKTRSLVLAGIAACTSTAMLLLSCASDESVTYAEPDSGATTVPPEPADGGEDALPDADAGPCVDCEYFPETCTDDVLCQNGPFAPNSPSALDPRTQINVIRGRSANDVWAVGALGAITHFDGTTWTRSDLGVKDTMLSLWLRSSAEVSLGTLQTIYTRGLDPPDAGDGADAGSPSPGGWSVRAGPIGPFDILSVLARFADAWGAPDSEWLWCAMKAITPGAAEGIWRVRMSPDTGAFELHDVVPTGRCNELPCSQLTSIHGVSADDIWAVGLMGSAIRIGDAESETPKIKVFNTQTWNALHGVWAASASEAWAVGAQGTIRHYTGDPVLWNIVSDVPTKVDLHAVWGSSPSDVWIVGDEGVVFHYDGTSWSRVKIAGLGGRRPNLTTVWSPAPGHVWIGGQGVLLSVGGKP